MTGYGVIEIEGSRLRCLGHGKIEAGRCEGFPERLHCIYQRLRQLLREHSPEVVAVEEVFYAANVKTALKLGHARGVILLAAAEAGLPVLEYSPLEVKKAVVGYGRADKGQIQMMVKTLLNLDAPPQPHDAADALAVAICHSFSGSPRQRSRRRWTSRR